MKILRYLITIVFPIIIFVFLTINVVNNNTVGFDNYVYQMVSKFISNNITEIMILISFFGSAEFLTALSLILIVALYKREKYSFYASMIVINILLSSLINICVKYIIHRNRPNILRLIEIGGFSFPSGHTMAAMSFYGFLVYLSYKNYNVKVKYLIIGILSITILLIGLSRIYLGVHYASDVLGGLSLGMLWLSGFSTIVEIKYKKKYAVCK